MPHRAHLFSLRLGHAFRESVLGGRYSWQILSQDALAGLTVGIIAIPLAMALAIASGVPPQYGLYTAIIAGFIIALSGGSRLSISGPTAAFVVILYPVAQAYGLAGLLVASVLSGFILLAMAFMRMGRFIEYIPESVVLGFTAGIAVVIFTLQLRDFLGLNIAEMPEHYLDKLHLLATTFHTVNGPTLLVAALTLVTMILWPRLRTRLPPHLPALALGTLAALLLNQSGYPVDTIGSRFSYELNGISGTGVPPVLPRFQWPWLQPGPGGMAIVWSLEVMQDMLTAAFAIAILGAIESLLCAVVVDNMSGNRHSANSELLGQGLGNIITPFFGGITATAALARSAANFRAGARTPVAAMIHSLVVLLALVAFSRLLSYLPMAAMAALLVMVAWNMSEIPKAVHLLRTAPPSDVIVLITCFALTILFDMVIAITTGMVLAAVLFVREIAQMTRVIDISRDRQLGDGLPADWIALKINGPLFFAAADRVFGETSSLCSDRSGILLYMENVTILDAGGVAALNKLIAQCEKTRTTLLISDLQFQPLRALARAGVQPIPGILQFFPSLDEALRVIRQSGAVAVEPAL